MKRLSVLCLTAVMAMFAASCGEPAANTATNTNSNTNGGKTAAAAPSKDALFELEKKANDSFLKGETAFFSENLSDNFVMYEHGRRVGKADVVRMIGATKCDSRSSTLEDPQMSTINADTVVMIYKSTSDGSCTTDGRTEKIPSPVRSATIWSREGDKWKVAYHGETTIIDPKAPPAPSAKEEPKKEAPKTEAEREPNTTTSAPNSNTNANAAPAEKPKADANTEALVKIHTSGWEAFKAKDAKKFEEITAKDISVIDPIGGYISGQADVIKRWTETMKCEGVTKVSVTDGFASAISPTVEILTLVGAADGTCDGQKNGDLYQTAIYVKEGDAWKLAFMQEWPKM